MYVREREIEKYITAMCVRESDWGKTRVKTLPSPFLPPSLPLEVSNNTHKQTNKYYGKSHQNQDLIFMMDSLALLPPSLPPSLHSSAHLEVVAKRPIPQHFKESMMIDIFTHIL